MAIFEKRGFEAEKKREVPEGLWQKCPVCGEVVHNLVLTENQKICSKCDHHFPQSARERIEHLLDPDSFEEHDQEMASVDTLKFKGMAAYTERLKTYQQRTGLRDAVISGIGSINGQKISLAAMDFLFLAATMGSVVGEKITRAIERGTKKKLPVVIIAASGGARVYEGMLSLMQMAKTSAALALHAQAHLPYISILTNPTTAGVMASFASLGDVIIAEPRCMIGFAGPRVIRETTHQDLPSGFQTAEFLLAHGLVDSIVHRKKMRATLSDLLRYLKPRNRSRVA